MARRTPAASRRHSRVLRHEGHHALGQLISHSLSRSSRSRIMHQRSGRCISRSLAVDRVMDTVRYRAEGDPEWTRSSSCSTQAVAKHRDLPALIIKPGFRTRIWTYADIGDLVPRVAEVLRAAGVQPGDRVLIWAVNRPEWGIAFLGALWAGAVAVPVDVRTTDELATKIAAQTRAKLVLASLPTMKAASRLELPALDRRVPGRRGARRRSAPPPGDRPGRPGRDRLTPRAPPAIRRA